MTTDALSFLADSPVRARLIDALRRDGPARPSDLTATLDVSRATIHRNLSALTDRGWVRQESDGYDATTAGELVYERFDAFRTGVETVDRFERLLEIIPASGVPPLSVLATADLVTAEPDKPHAPVMRYVEELTATETTTVSGLSPVRSEMFDHGHEQLLEAGVDTTLVMPVDVLEREREEAGEEMAAALQRDGFEVYALQTEPGFGLSVTDDRAFLGGYSADNQLQALVVSTDESFVEWATETFESIRDRAEPVTAQRAEVDTQSEHD
jgi:predicted transcriptional regulator